MRQLPKFEILRSRDQPIPIAASSHPQAVALIKNLPRFPRVRRSPPIPSPPNKPNRNVYSQRVKMPPPEPRGGRKRRRIAIACNECRDRKRKCDGVKPICGSCIKRSSAQCIWEEGRNSKGWSNRCGCP